MNSQQTDLKKELKVFLNPELIIVGLKARDKEEVVRKLAALYLERGYVKETYADAVLEREISFPTGLPTLDVHVAIPHTDIAHCIKPGMAVAILEEPVEFLEMATLDKTVYPEIVFLLSIIKPEDQVIWLQRLVTRFQTEGFLKKLRNVPDAKACYELLQEELAKEDL